MHTLELKIPPGAVGAVMAAGMWLVARMVPLLAFSFQARQVVAIGLGLAGGIVAVMGVISFRRAKTTVNPLKPNTASALVVSGIYQKTRNPMYLGMLLILLGWAIELANATALVFVPAFVIYMNRFQIVPEERALTALFGAQFTAYRAVVRRWI